MWTRVNAMKLWSTTSPGITPDLRRYSSLSIEYSSDQWIATYER